MNIYYTINLMKINEINIVLEPHIKIKHSYKAISKILSKEVYLFIIKKISKLPTALETWIDIYPFLENADWEHIFKLPYTITQEPYL